MPNLYQKLVELRKSVPALAKSTKGYNYNYVSSSQTLTAVRDEMDRLGLMLIPSVVGSKVNEFKTAKGSTQFMTELTMVYTLVNSDDPTDRLALGWYAQGVDDAEKGVGKAYTYGEKYLLLKLLNVPTDKDDPDAHQAKPTPKGEKAPAGKAPRPSETLPAQVKGVLERGLAASAAEASAALPSNVQNCLKVFQSFGVDRGQLEKRVEAPATHWGDNEIATLRILREDLQAVRPEDRKRRLAELGL